MEPDQAKGPEEEKSTKDMKAKPSGTKRKFVSQMQFDDLQTTVAEMRRDMASLILLNKDSVTPAKQVCIEEPCQPASNTVLTVPTNGNQFLAQTEGNQFAIPSIFEISSPL